MNDIMLDADVKRIPLIEFIPTWQGEGPNAGKRMLLIRYKNCNRKCVFCDTQTKMQVPETLYSLNDIDNEVCFYRNIMITGGEPTMRTPTINNLQNTIDILNYCLFDFADVETNGLNLIELLFAVQKIEHDNPSKEINVSWSPKFADVHDIEGNLETIRNMQAGIPYAGINIPLMKFPNMKLVISDDLAKEFLEAAINLGFDRNKIFLMPLGTNLEEIQNSFKGVTELAEKHNCHISSRLHLIHNFS